MRRSKQDVVDRALGVLDDYGLADLSMRRLGTELGVQPSALYHHFANKQSLLAAIADEILARQPRVPSTDDAAAALLAYCHRLRSAMLAFRDGAEVVATAHAFGLGAQAVERDLRRLVRAAGASDELADAGASTLLYFILGQTWDEQTHLQAAGAGAIEADWSRAPRPAADFELGLGVILAGLAVSV